MRSTVSCVIRRQVLIYGRGLLSIRVVQVGIGSRICARVVWVLKIEMSLP
jgi:hypothetical protein